MTDKITNSTKNRFQTAGIKVENGAHNFFLHVDRDEIGNFRGLNYSSRHEASDMHDAMSAVCALTEMLLFQGVSPKEIREAIPFDGLALSILKATEEELNKASDQVPGKTNQN